MAFRRQFRSAVKEQIYTLPSGFTLSQAPSPSISPASISSIHSLSQYLETKKELPANPYKSPELSMKPPARGIGTSRASKYVFFQASSQLTENSTPYITFPFDGERFRLVDALICGVFVRGCSLFLNTEYGDNIAEYKVLENCKVFRWDFSLETENFNSLSKFTISCRGPVADPEEDERVIQVDPLDSTTHGHSLMSEISSIELHMVEKEGK